jgi:hypothetical protein
MMVPSANQRFVSHLSKQENDNGQMLNVGFRRFCERAADVRTVLQVTAIPRPFPRLLPHRHQRRGIIDEPTGCGKRRAGPMLVQHQRRTNYAPH